MKKASYLLSTRCSWAIKVFKNESQYSQRRGYQLFPYKGIMFGIELFSKRVELIGGHYGII
ncbi:hypothetical protein CON65_16750 [Bacillus pseudomycoides]|uniref:Uncharacterized protein n=1 Tax=Bacillus pseudomycoides TaxID=64104 RepID=A0AA91VAN1_9BACI|nr:hypothetical protein COO03_00855 [Bacillus sp. AFS098217]PED81501.1 hypothetical protein CON65_16750 [Bacillus pseudomycoides]PEU09392.1 hypothetical protein CN524_18310 [Bacillus sp. AFS019443]PEU12539.1 hypothetical protein CN525_20810 [Bacillus sp. AFS014408]PFW61818.1 hypothetical protein COL20_15895 [Bacillus sp. AFS075034]